jgi:hypothetical protein
VARLEIAFKDAWLSVNKDEIKATAPSANFLPLVQRRFTISFPPCSFHVSRNAVCGRRSRGFLNAIGIGLPELYTFRRNSLPARQQELLAAPTGDIVGCRRGLI